MNTTYITAAQLRKKLNEIDEKIKLASKEKEHIEYVLETLLQDSSPDTAEQLQLFITTRRKDNKNAAINSDRGENKIRRKELLQNICRLLKENKKPMKSKTLYQQLKKIEPSLHKPTFDAYMSEWCKERDAKIWRVHSGVYDIISRKTFVK